MNILITNFHPGHGGGHYTYIKYLFEHINKQDINLFLALPKTSNLYQELSHKSNTVFAIDFPSKIKEFSNIVKNIKKLKNVITKYKIDTIHVNGTPDHKIVMWCIWFYNLDVKVIRTKHNSTPVKNNIFNKKLYGKYTYKLIVVSQYQYQQLDKTLQDKTTVIHNGIDLEYYKPQPKNADLLQQYNITDDDLVFVSVAGTALHKGWQYLVQAISKLNKPNYKIIIAGHYPNENIIDEYVTKYNMQSQVIFTGMQKDVRNVISIGDIGFVLSKEEALSIACREMMAMGKPVIVSNVGGLPENVDNNNDGWIVDVNNKQDFKDILKNVVKSNFNDFSKNATQKAIAGFGLHNFVDKTYKIYKNL
jgi:glycosyltransferase involved in cell wall biosynthesis